MRIIFIIILCPILIFAASPGTSSLNFLNYSPGARGSAMTAFSSVSNDAFSSYYNPSALINIEQTEIGATYNKSFENISNQYLSIAYPYKIGQVFAFSYSGLSYGDIQGYDASGYATKIIKPSDKAFIFSYSKSMTKDEIERSLFSLGGNFKYVSENLDDKSASAFAFDFGALYSLRPDNYWLSEIPGQEFKFSAVLKNIGTKIKFDKEGYSLPMSLTLGSSWIMHPWGKHKLILSMDSVLSNDDKFKINFGSEYSMYQLLAVRLGYESGKYIGSKINFGIGFKLSFIDIDYSMTPFGELGSMQKISLLVKFGERKGTQPLKGEVLRVENAKLIAPKEKIEKLEEFSQDYIKLAEKDIEERKYISAIENLKKAFNLEPNLKKGNWGKVNKRLNNIILSLRLNERPEKMNVLYSNNEQSNIFNEAIKSYINSEDLKALLLAHISYGTNIKGDTLFEEGLYSLSELTKMPVKSDEILPKDSWITQKLKKSAGYFYVRQYNMVIKETEEIILVEPNNYLAWTRLGSAYFMLGDKEKARKAYEKAISLNPNDIVTLRFMQSQGWK